MRAKERSSSCVKQRKHIALLLITIIMMMLMKGCEGCVETERMGLLQLKSYLKNLYNATEESFLDSWSHNDSESDCCHWERVKCSDTIGGHIAYLTLSDIMPYTDVPRPLNLSLFHSFPQLETLHLSRNCLTDLFDPINGYKSFQILEKLKTVDLFDNRLNNSVLPFLSAARSLRTLDLSYNLLEAVMFPSSLQVLNLAYNQLSLTHEGYSEICRLRYLSELDLSSNALTNLPYCLGNLSHLQTLRLSNNQREGVLSLNGVVFPSSLLVLNLRRNQLSLTHEGYSEICRLRHLRELDLSSNALTNLPYCLGNLSHLRTLDLSNNQLNGNLSSFVSDLPSALEYLSLLDNNFNGLFFFKSLVNQTRLAVFILSSKVGMIQSQTENSWFPLFQLKILKLQNFSFGSTVPGFLVHQHDLFFIDISHNKLKGAFPTWLVQNNTRLEILLLHSNSLTKLQLPRLVHGLQVLDISRNRIYGTIQEDVGIVFPKLRYMDFASNYFHGTIPSSMGEMKSLFFLDMSSNDLYGQLPKIFLSGCYSLSVLKLSNNQFHGKIFPEHVNLTDLVFLFLDGNNFNGSLEKGLLKLKKLDLLDISNNRISGILPLWIGRVSLGTLDVSGNQLKGPFPVQLQNLYFIDISHNSFSGSIPRNVNFSFLTELRLQNNEFMGSIPDTLLKSPKLEVLDLRNNNISGNIPDTIGNASVLGALLLRNNSLQSHTLERICQLSKVNLLDLSHNKLKGVIPSCLGNMSFGRESNDGWFPGFSYELGIGASSFLQNWSYTSALSLDYDDLRHVFRWNPEPTVDFLTKSRYESYQGDILSYMYGLDLSNNQISGDIPIEIGDLENIRSLNLSGNHLTGSIPNSFSKLKDLGSLDLSNNKLDGNIPPMLADLNSLGYFNVSCNNLSGEIPFKGHLLTFGTMSYIGNAHLCGRPTNKSCNPTGVLEPSASKQAKEEEEEEDDVIDMVWFYWTCGAVYISTSLALFVFLCIDSHWSRKWDYGVDLFIYHLQRFKGGFFSS